MVAMVVSVFVTCGTQHKLNSDRLCKEVINIYTRLTLTFVPTVVILLTNFKHCQSPHC